MVNEQDVLLLWIRTGTATLRENSRVHHLRAGQGIWVPPGLPHEVELDADSLAIPMFISARSVADFPRRVIRIEMPLDWGDWLLLEFARNIGYLRVEDDRDPPDFALPPDVTPGDIGGIPHAPLPYSTDLLVIAQDMAESPASKTTIATYAQRAQRSVRTLQRQFREETGLPLHTWRARMRLRTAARLLEQHHRIKEAAIAAGYGSASALGHAFRRRVGITPKAYRAVALARRARGSFADDVGHWPSQAMASPEAPPAPPHELPASSTWLRVNDYHVAVWMYRGSAHLRISHREWLLREGDAIYIPAGMPNKIDIHPGSLLLPLGIRPPTGKVNLDSLRVWHFKPEDEDFLLHTVIAAHTLLRPSDHHRAGAATSFQELALEPDSGGDGIVARIATALHIDPGDSRHLRDWAQAMNVPFATAKAEFAAETGTSFPRWRAQLRMSIALRMLHTNARIADISQRLGYSQPAVFSRVFTLAHGVSPRAYRKTVDDGSPSG